MKKLLLSSFFLSLFTHLCADVNPPVIVLKNGKVQEIQIGASVSIQEPLSVSDDITDSADIIVTVGWGFNGTVNSTKRGTYPLYIEARDEAGNSSYDTVKFVVDDFIPPTINLNTDDEVCTELGKAYNSVPATVTDNYYNSSQVSLIKISSNVNPNVLGTYEEVFEATDGSGNVTRKTRIVHVMEKCNTVGLDGVSLDNVQLYPNPANDILYVMGYGDLSDLHVVLFDAIGNKVLEIENSDIIEIAQLPAGFYSALIEVNGALVQRKLIIGF